MFVLSVPKAETVGQCLSNGKGVKYRVQGEFVEFRYDDGSDWQRRAIQEVVEDGAYLRFFCRDDGVHHILNTTIDEWLDWADVEDEDAGNRRLIAFHDWKVAVIEGILRHPAMQPEANPVVKPDFASPIWEQMWKAGKTVEEMLAWADEQFNISGY